MIFNNIKIFEHFPEIRNNMNRLRHVIKLTKRIVAFLPAAFLLLMSCSDQRNVNTGTKEKDNFSLVWYRQAKVDLGARIKMFSLNDGIAISKGRGDISGQALKFSNGRWEEFHSFPYSDFPQIIKYDSNTIWTINHLTHNGFYKPVLTVFSEDKKEIMPLPSIMWDDIDYAMFRTLHAFSDGTAWMAGQQGNILYFNGEKWIAVESPVVKEELLTPMKGDINDIFFHSDENGWGVGKDGIILKFENNTWQKFPSPVTKHLNRIWMLNDTFGFIAGNQGTLLRFDGTEWKQEKFESPFNLLSVKGVDSSLVIAVGDNSSFYFYDGETWRRDNYLRSLGETFTDIEIIIDDDSNPHVWLTGWEGIYTNSKTLGFSFTDFTSQASLRETGRAGFFFTRQNKNFPDLFVINENAPSLLYHNLGNAKFAEINVESVLLDLPEEVVSVAAGDINNDGFNDLIVFYNSGTDLRMLLGTGSGFIDFTERSKLDLSGISPLRNFAATLVDLDNDGSLDLYISSYEGRPHIFRGEGTGRFYEVKDYSGIDISDNIITYGATFSDFNSDGLIDILIPYYAGEEGKNAGLFLNMGNFRFESTNDPAFILSEGISVATSVAIAADFNNDGYPDIIIHNQKAPPALLINIGDGTFRNMSEQAGFTETIFHPEPLNGTLNAADVNNDGYVDLFIGSKLFMNGPGMYFTEVSERTGVNFIGTPSFEDIDNDGDIDLFIGSSVAALGKGERSVLYRNNLNNNNFIKVRSEGDISNRSATGSKIYLFSYDERNRLLSTQLREQGLGHSPMVQQNLNELHFGLSPASRYDVVVKFPSGIKKVYGDVSPGRILSVSESNLFNALYSRIEKSIERTLQLANPAAEIIKGLFIIGIVILLMIFGKRNGAEKYALGFSFPFGLVLLYLFAVHYTVLNNFFIQILFPFLLVPAVGFAAIIIARASIRKQETQYLSHFKVGELLGQGGMGKVFKAVDINKKQTVVLKILNPELLNDPGNKKRFTNEGALLSKFDHPCIVKVFEIGEVDSKGFIAMEYLPNGTLSDYLKKNYPLSFNEIKNIALQICDGLIEIHSKSILHRDLKTNNIMLDESNNIRIMDFGLSKSNLVTTMTSLGTVIGTLGYVAPEQITNSYTDQRTDIFSLGVIFYELCTNQLPFTGENEIALIHSIFNTHPAPPSTINPGIPEAFDRLIDKCLKKNHEERYVNVNNVAARIRKI